MNSASNIVLAVASVICFTILLWGFFVWPTMYRYEIYGCHVLRITRVNGNVEHVFPPEDE